MAITRSTGVRNSDADAVADAVDVGTTNTEGAIVYMTSGDVEVATMRMSNPAFGAAASGIATANAITNDSNATGGVVALFKVVDRDDAEVFRGTVGLDGSGEDLELDPDVVSLTVAAAAIVGVSSFTYVAG